jgi:hypothetical protein
LGEVVNLGKTLNDVVNRVKRVLYEELCLPTFTVWPIDAGSGKPFVKSNDCGGVD